MNEAGIHAEQDPVIPHELADLFAILRRHTLRYYKTNPVRDVEKPDHWQAFFFESVQQHCIGMKQLLSELQRQYPAVLAQLSYETMELMIEVHDLGEFAAGIKAMRDGLDNPPWQVHWRQAHDRTDDGYAYQYWRSDDEETPYSDMHERADIIAELFGLEGEIKENLHACWVTDSTPRDNPGQNRHQYERQAFEHMLVAIVTSDLSTESQKATLLAVYEEYEARSTLESQMVKFLDIAQTLQTGAQCINQDEVIASLSNHGNRVYQALWAQNQFAAHQFVLFYSRMVLEARRYA